VAGVGDAAGGVEDLDAEEIAVGVVVEDDAGLVLVALGDGARRRRWRSPGGDSGCESAAGMLFPLASPPNLAQAVPLTQRSSEGVWGKPFSSRRVPPERAGKESMG